MSRMKSAVLAVFLLLSFALSLHTPARAVNNIMFDDDYNWGVNFASFTSVTSYTFAVNPLLPASAGYVVGGSTPNVVGYSYQILSVGGSANFTISQTTQTFSYLAQATTGFNSPAPLNLHSSNYRVPVISTSTLITIPSGTTMRDAYSDTFRAKTQDPVFNFSGLSTADTTYIWVTFGAQRR